MNRLTAFAAACGIAAALPFGAAQAQLHGVNPFSNSLIIGPGNGGLFRLDTETGAIVQELDITPSSGGAVTGANSITIDPTTGIYYVVLKQAATSGRTLATIDVVTGNATILGNLGDNFSSIAFRDDGQLFGVTGDGASVPETLYTIDKTNATKTVAATLGAGADGELIAHHPGDHAFYHWSGNGTVVFERIADTPPYTVTNIPITGTTSGESFGAVWDACRQRFLVHNISSFMYLWTTGGVVSDPQPSTAADIRGLALVSGNLCEADLELSAAATPFEPAAGAATSVAFDLVNVGPARARNTVLTLVPGATLGAPITTGCAEDPNGIPTCSLGIVLGGEMRQVTVSGLFAAGGFVSGSVASDSTDPVPANNAARVLLGPIATVDPAAGLATAEDGTQDTLTVVLNQAPLDDVSIPVLAGNPSEAAVGAATLVFTPADWNVAQSITVTGVNDDVDDGDQPFAVLLGAATSTDASFDGRQVDDAGGSNADDDTAAIVVQALTPLLTSEAGLAASFTVRLASEPLADVTLPVASNAPAEGNTDLALLTFTAADWDVPQTVMLTGADDAIDDGNVDYSVTFGQAASTDPAYDGQQPAALAAQNADDDIAGIVVQALTPLLTSETGEAATFTVRMASQPIADVTLPVASDTPAEGTTDLALLTFTAADWDIPQTVTLTGADDAIDDGTIDYAVVFGQAASADPAYDGQQPAALAARNVDDDGADAAGTVRFDALCGIEASEGQGSVVLRVLREGDLAVGVRVSTSDGSATQPADYTAVDQVLAWDVLDTTPRDIVIPLIEDGIDDRGESFFVTLSQPSGGVQPGAPAQVRVTLRNGVLFGNGFEDAACPP